MFGTGVNGTRVKERNLPDLKGLRCLAFSVLALLVAPGCPTATTGSSGGTSTGGTSSGTSGGGTSTGTTGGSSGGVGSSTGGGGSSTGGSTTGGSSGGSTSGSTGAGSSSGGTSSGGSTGGSTTGGTGGTSSGGSTGGADAGASDGGADAGAGDAGCVLADCEDAGYTCCQGFDHCVDITNDSANCGVCGTLCAIDQICTGSLCGPAPCNGSLCGVAGGCCLDSCCHAGEICCQVHIGAVTVSCYDATDGCPLSCKLCP